jgi:ATP-dependent protease HslVU (ClpYQ) peptidase subunit
MTCIVGLESNGKAYLGCDSFLGSMQGKEAIDRPKIVQKGPDLLIGFAGSLRVPQILEYGTKFRRPRKGEDGHAYLVTEVVPKLRKACHRAGAISREGNGPDLHDTEFVVALRDQIFQIQGDFSVYRPAPGYTAAGAGAWLALGALGATSDLKMEPAQRCALALQVAENHSPAVMAPFVVVST